MSEGPSQLFSGYGYSASRFWAGPGREGCVGVEIGGGDDTTTSTYIQH